MGKVWFTADLHFTHTRIIELSNRPFRDAQDMDETLIRNWNETVAPDDVVWVLGDFAIEGGWEKALTYVPRLNGHKRLISGNHDRCWAGKSDAARFQRFYFEAGFEVVDSAGRTKLPSVRQDERGRKVVLSHFPYREDHTDDARHTQFRLPDTGGWLVHGHVHEAFTVAERGVNVGVDRWDFRPVSALKIAQIIDEHERTAPVKER